MSVWFQNSNSVVVYSLSFRGSKFIFPHPLRKSLPNHSAANRGLVPPLQLKTSQSCVLISARSVYSQKSNFHFVKHTHYPHVPTFSWNPSLAWKVVLFGVIAGLIAMVFVKLTHLIKDVMKKYVAWYPARPVIGGVIVATLILVFGWRDYSGVSIPLALEAMNGANRGLWFVKLGLTALTLGSGFVGGEVVPLFVTGALAGGSYAHMIGANVPLFAIVGSLAVLAAAANTPLACTVLGIELFGGEGIILFAVVCAAAYATSGHTGIYHTQKVSVHKSGEVTT